MCVDDHPEWTSTFCGVPVNPDTCRRPAPEWAESELKGQGTEDGYPNINAVLTGVGAGGVSIEELFGAGDRRQRRLDRGAVTWLSQLANAREPARASASSHSLSACSATRSVCSQPRRPAARHRAGSSLSSTAQVAAWTNVRQRIAIPRRSPSAAAPASAINPGWALPLAPKAAATPTAARNAASVHTWTRPSRRTLGSLPPPERAAVRRKASHTIHETAPAATVVATGASHGTGPVRTQPAGMTTRPPKTTQPRANNHGSRTTRTDPRPNPTATACLASRYRSRYPVVASVSSVRASASAASTSSRGTGAPDN